MELKDLEGKHKLDAVDFSNEKVKTWGESYEDCQVMRFRLDGKVYTATEDPDDGYRSSMKEIVISEDQMVNTFPPVEVIGKHRTKGEYSGEDDILELIDTETGKVVIEVGTTEIDDYYPGFVANFNPENMITNKSIAQQANAPEKNLE